MELTQLVPGLYKVIKKNAGGLQHQGIGQEVHLLYIMGYGAQREVHLDQIAIPAESDHLINIQTDYELVSRLPYSPVIQRPRITISWYDGDGDEFSFTICDTWHLKQILEVYPWLRDTFDLYS